MTDKELNFYKQTIHSEFPGIKVKSMGFLGEGWMSKAMLVNDEWVFRFAKNEEASKDLEKEVKILPYLSKIITLAIPEFEYVGEQENGLLFVGYKKIPGEILDQKTWDIAPNKDREKMAQQLAHFIKELSDLPLEIARNCKVPENDFQKDFKKTFKKVQASIFPLLDESLRHYLTSNFETYLRNSSYFDYQPTLIHADLSPNHYLWDKHTGQLTGIIDFGDLSIGDPDFEYTYPLEDGGEFFARRVMAFREEKDIENLLKKVRIFVVFTHVATILEGLKKTNKTMIEEGIEALKANCHSSQSLF